RGAPHGEALRPRRRLRQLQGPQAQRQIPGRRREVTPGKRYLLHLLGNSAIHALGLVLLYRDCRNNSALSDLTVFYVPLGAAALYLSAGLVWFERKGDGIPKSGSWMVLGAGILVALVIVA